MKVALVYDWVDKWGGAERVLLALHEIWPQAPLFTSVYRPQTAQWAKKFTVKPSFLTRFPWRHEWLAPLMPLAFESFSAKGGPASGWDFDDFDLVISVSSSFAKGIITKPATKHINYCLTPTRFLWNRYQWPMGWLRSWDKIAAQRPDQIIAISKTVQQRIKRYYDLGSQVIYPPVDINRFKIQDSRFKSYFLVVSRLVKYKRVDLAIRAFNQLGWPLKIVGTGQQERHLKAMAKANIEFLGQLTDRQLVGYYQKCCGLVFPQEEDFGLVAVEAQACGRPVIAYRAGGALETVVAKKTGIFFGKQTVDSLVEGLKKFVKIKFSPEVCRQNALRFDKQKFKKKMIKLIK